MSEQTILIDVRCECPGRPRVPVRLTTQGLLALRAALNSHASMLDGETVAQTHYCKKCQSVQSITFRDLMLAA